MIGFGIDETQAEYVADIKLRNINKGYILKRIEEIDSLKEEIADMEDILSSERRVKQIIISELGDIANKYGNTHNLRHTAYKNVEVAGENVL